MAFTPRWSAALLACTLVQGVHAQHIDVDAFAKRQGWASFEVPTEVKSPSVDLVPVVYYAPQRERSCGLIAGQTGKPPQFIELLSSGESGWPYCGVIESMRPFRLLGKEYVAVEYRVHDTREDVYRTFHYVARDASGWHADTSLSEAVPQGDATVRLSKREARQQDGIHMARAEVLKRAMPGWRLRERELIADQRASFGVFDKAAAHQCSVAIEAGSAPAVVSLADFAPGAPCNQILASSSLDQRAIRYFLVLFKTADAKPVVAIVSLGADGRISAEKSLSAAVNAAGASADIKSVKAALLALVR